MKTRSIPVVLALVLAACGAGTNHEADVRTALDHYLAPYYGRDAAESYAALSRKSASQLPRASYLRAAKELKVAPEYYSVEIKSVEVDRSSMTARAEIKIVITDPNTMAALSEFGGDVKESVDLDITYGLVHEDDQWKVELDEHQLSFEKARLLSS